MNSGSALVRAARKLPAHCSLLGVVLLWLCLAHVARAQNYGSWQTLSDGSGNGLDVSYAPPEKYNAYDGNGYWYYQLRNRYQTQVKFVLKYTYLSGGVAKTGSHPYTLASGQVYRSAGDWVWARQILSWQITSLIFPNSTSGGTGGSTGGGSSGGSSSGSGTTTTTSTGSSQVAAEMRDPVNGATLEGTGVTFTWGPGSGASQYVLYVGSVAGGSNYANVHAGLSRAAYVSGLPRNGSTIYVRLWTLLGNQWFYRDYHYTAAPASIVTAKAVMVSPANGSTFVSTSATFTWTAGTGVAEYFLYLGNSLGANDLYAASQGLLRGRSLIRLPSDGRVIYVRLFSRIGTTWVYSDTTYQSAVGSSAPVYEKADMRSPAPGSTFLSQSADLTWSAGTGAAEYFLYLGNQAGGNDLYASSRGTSTKVTLSNLPDDGRVIYVRLWTRFGTAWQYADYVYYAFKKLAVIPLKAALIEPVTGTVIPDQLFFKWDAGVSVTGYWLYIGTEQGTSNIFNSNNVVDVHSQYVSYIPPTVNLIFVRLFSLIGGTWQHADYEFDITHTSGL